MIAIRILTLITFLVFFLPVSLFAQSWDEYNANPVLREWSGSPQDPSYLKYAFEPDVRYDSSAGVFHMWLTSFTYGFGAAFSVSDAISLDGKEWFIRAMNPVLAGGSPGVFDTQIRSPRILTDDAGYRMYYTGQASDSYRIGVATSLDGRSWDRYSNTPILQPDSGAWDGVGVSFCSVLHVDSGYTMWYTGSNATQARIGLATSTDGFHWTKYPGNPVFSESSSGWDSNTLVGPSVVHVDGTYYMFYLGQSTSICCSFAIGWATSIDGISWTRQSVNPLLRPDKSWDNVSLGGLSVLYKDSKFHIWFSGQNSTTNHWQIGYATGTIGPDGVQLSKQGLPSTFKLSDAYPNPFNPSTTFSFDISHSSFVTLKVFDLLGKEIATIANEQLAPGIYSRQWNAPENSSGVYFYRLTAGTFTQTKKLVLMK